MPVRLRVLTVVAMLGLAAALLMRGRSPGDPQDYGAAPSFALRDQRDRPVTDQDLRGAPWVANFVFTRCTAVCPLLTAKFANLQSRASDLEGVRWVSFSVDPDYDTPAVLVAYAARFEADASSWSFLTGPLDDIERTVVKGFKIHIGQPEPSEDDPGLMDIMHGEHFIVVDAGGQIHGYYRSDTEGTERLLRELRDLLD